MSKSDRNLERILRPVRRISTNTLTDMDATRAVASCHLAGDSHSLISDVVVGVLGSLQLTSAGVERMFSLLSGVQTKYQGRMKDEKLKTMMFLRSIHMKQNPQDFAGTLENLCAPATVP